MPGSTVDKIWDASPAIDDIVSDYKGHYITFKKYHETGHMSTVAYQPNHRYRKERYLLMKDSNDSWLATIHFFDRHLKKYYKYAIIVPTKIKTQFWLVVQT